MQGRLSPQVDGKIQAFPWAHWKDEFALAQKHGFDLMEWTLDQDRLDENPLITKHGREEIRELSKKHGVEVLSLTGDNFMQAPFYKFEGLKRDRLIDDMKKIVDACADLGVLYVLIPLVDAGRIEDEAQEVSLRKGLEEVRPTLKSRGMRIVFESDFPPARLADFMETFPTDTCGINYDIGNSASLGYKPEEEIAAYGARIVNVHVKDRLLGGTTVPLGTGNADIQTAIRALKRSGYHGNYILQTARAQDGNHAEVLCRYRDMTRAWINS
jgi:hexulose-6-phosphate isomerase